MEKGGPQRPKPRPFKAHPTTEWFKY